MTTLRHPVNYSLSNGAIDIDARIVTFRIHFPYLLSINKKFCASEATYIRCVNKRFPKWHKLAPWMLTLTWAMVPQTILTPMLTLSMDFNLSVLTIVERCSLYKFWVFNDKFTSSKEQHNNLFPNSNAVMWLIQIMAAKKVMMLKFPEMIRKIHEFPIPANKPTDLTEVSPTAY